MFQKCWLNPRNSGNVEAKYFLLMLHHLLVKCEHLNIEANTIELH